MLIRFLDLTENLRFADDQRIEARSDAKQMFDRLGVGVAIEMAVQGVGRKPMELTDEGFEAMKAAIRAGGRRGEQLDAVAG